MGPDFLVETWSNRFTIAAEKAVTDMKNRPFVRAVFSIALLAHAEPSEELPPWPIGAAGALDLADQDIPAFLPRLIYGC